MLRAIAETGVHGRTRTAVLERPVFEALTAAAPRRRPGVRRRHGEDRAAPGGTPPARPPPRPRRLTRAAAAVTRPRTASRRPGLLPSGRDPARPRAAAPDRRQRRPGAARPRSRRRPRGSQLEATLHDIVQAAVQHVDAGYGAMGVLTPDGRRLDRFVIVGMGAEDAGADRPAARRARSPGAAGRPSRRRCGSTTSAPAPGADRLPARSSADALVPRRPGPRGRRGLRKPLSHREAHRRPVQRRRRRGRAGAGRGRRAWRSRTPGWPSAPRPAAAGGRPHRDGDGAAVRARTPTTVLRRCRRRCAALTSADMAGVLAPSLDDDGP